MPWFDFMGGQSPAGAQPLKPRHSGFALGAVYATILLLGCSLFSLSRAYRLQVASSEDRAAMELLFDDLRHQVETARLEQERRDLELCRALMGPGLDGDCQRIAIAGVRSAAMAGGGAK